MTLRVVPFRAVRGDLTTEQKIVRGMRQLSPTIREQLLNLIELLVRVQAKKAGGRQIGKPVIDIERDPTRGGA